MLLLASPRLQQGVLFPCCSYEIRTGCHLDRSFVLLAAGFVLTMGAVGFWALVPLGLARRSAWLAFAPTIGVAAFAVLGLWASAAGIQMIARPAVILASIVALPFGGRRVGLLRATDFADHGCIPVVRTLVQTVAAVCVIVLMGFGQVQTPLWNDDGAFHAEVIDAIRNGREVSAGNAWYPTGYHQAVAGYLQFFPGVDSSYGTFWASVGLVLVGVLAVFGLAQVIWGSPIVSATSALLATFTFMFPYNPQFWGFWPLAAGIVLVLALWACAIEYVQEPRTSWTVLAGLLAAGIVLIHGSEVYTALVGLLLIIGTNLRVILKRRAALDVVMAAVLAAALVGPYLVSVISWASAGGAAATGTAWLNVIREKDAGESSVDLILLGLNATSTGTLFDVIPRLILFFVSAWWAFRMRSGRLIFALIIVFFGIGCLFTVSDMALVRSVHAVTFPWGERDRMAMVVAALTPVAGGVAAVTLWPKRWQSVGQPSLRRQVAIGVLSSLLVGCYAVLLGLRLSVRAMEHNVYTADDAEAIAWLHENARPGEVLANDQMADAGIWAPFKAGVPVLVTRSGADSPETRLILDNVHRLEDVPNAAAAACDARVRYVYYGAKSVHVVPGRPERLIRHYPPVAALQQSRALREVYRSGPASVFRVELPCFG